MPRNSEENVYIQVPFSRNSPVLARLKVKMEQAQTSKKKVLFLGPYIAEILAKLDVQQQNELEGKVADMTPSSLKELLDEAIRAALEGVSFQKVSQFEMTDKEEIIQEEAANLLAALGGDDWDEEG